MALKQLEEIKPVYMALVKVYCYQSLTPGLFALVLVCNCKQLD